MRVERAVLAMSGVLVVAAGVIAVWLTYGRTTAATSGAQRGRTHDVYVPRPARPEPLQLAPPGAATDAGPMPLAPPAEQAPLQLIRDPLDPDYDAARLYGAIGGSPVDLFAKEPRDKAWADQREKDIVDLTLPAFREVDPNAKIEVQCHTGTCRVSVHSRDKRLTTVMGDYPLACLANKSTPVWGPGIEDASGPGSDVADPYSDFYMFFGAATRGRDGMLARTKADPTTGQPGTCLRYRDEWLAEARGGSQGEPR